MMSYQREWSQPQKTHALSITPTAGGNNGEKCWGLKHRQQTYKTTVWPGKFAGKILKNAGHHGVTRMQGRRESVSECDQKSWRESNECDIGRDPLQEGEIVGTGKNGGNMTP